MFKNHLKVAWRNLKNNRIFSVINVLGLSLGLAITILLFLFVSYEHSYDSMYENKADIHRVLVHTGDSFENEVFCTAPAAVAPALKEEAPEIKYAARMLKHDFGEPAFIKVNDVNLIEKELYYCDPELFTIFGIDIIKGQPQSALERPNTTVISQSTAAKYFGAEDPIGKLITVDNRKQLEIVGVFKDFPSNSTLHCNVIASFSSTNFAKNATWSNSSFETYIQLEKNTSIASMEGQLQRLLDKNVDKEGQWFTLGLQPLEEVHLYSSDYTNSYTSRIGNIKEIKNLSILALLILIIACINYMNLITARSQKRAKDVGINKTLGASLKNMIIRFYAETGLITFIALLIGLVIAITAVPIFNAVTDQEMDISLLINFKFLLGLIAFWVLTTLVAGSYPAFYLSSSSPKTALSSSAGKVGGVISVRKGLVVLQFAASAILIVAVLVIYQQLQFMQNKKLGYNPENVVAISTSAIRGIDKKEALIQEFRSLSNVSSVALAQGFPGITVSGRTLLKDENDSKGASIQTNYADPTVLDVLQLRLLAGSNLPRVKQEGDTIVDVVLNEKAVAYLGLSPEEAIGEKVTMSLGNNAYIRGVVEDFNFSSLHRPIGGYAFHNSPREPKYFVLVRFNSKSTNAVMSQLETIFDRVVTNSVFEYTFLDKKIESLYAQERKVARVGLIFCVLAIFVACLGLFGLAAYTAEQRKKEIGVRKVLGATVMGITQMLSKDFLKLVFVSLLIAFPIAFIVMQNWLEEFAYRINVNWSVFVIAAMSAFLIAIITVSFQAVKAAMTNPVNSLRTE